MNPILQLAPAVADAIAAGEVVERPASVIKELCENALDAGATRVDVNIEGGGVVRISVVDDGAGIAANDLPLAVARHATSKIRSADDLERVSTLGFRGEALASIAAVSDLRIVSRRSQDVDAHVLRTRAAEIVERGRCAAAPGTTVEVRDLFFATPARLRFLRAPRTETALAQRTVAELVLAHPEVAFSCRVDGRVALHSPGASLPQALRAVFGSAAAELLAVGGDGEIPVSGAISEPRAHRATRGGLVLVVNHRRVHNRALVAAVEEAYRGLLPGGRHPFGVVVADVDPVEVDVNVHPTKREVRFRDERRVFAAIQRACWVALGAARPYAATVVADHPAAMSMRLQLGDGDPGPAQRGWFTPAPAGDAVVAGITATVPLRPPPGRHGSRGGGLGDLGPLRALGQAGQGWIAAAAPDAIVLVDPHAAHEKVLYAELIARQHDVVAATSGSQLLLLPELVECDPLQLAAYEANRTLIDAFGLRLELFGPTTLRCDAVPAGARVGDAAGLVRGLLDTLHDGRQPSERSHRAAALIACHSAVRLGDELGAVEQQRLLDRLVVTPGAATCPHGRPTVVVLDDPTLRRAFRRPG